MDWALDFRGDHVVAAECDRYSGLLRCPVCKLLVYLRNGAFRRPHFAHFRGNLNKACELYYPGLGTNHGARGSHSALDTLPPGAPALVWKEDMPIPVGLHLRLSRFPHGYKSVITIRTSLGVKRLHSDALIRTTFTTLSLLEPVAFVETFPRDEPTEIRITSALQEFTRTGNFFKVTATGGTLEGKTSPLELGETYFHVTQLALPLPYPESLKVEEHKSDRGWHFYRLSLIDQVKSRLDDIRILKAFLSRDIVAPKPKVEVLWPPPVRFESDGTRIYESTTSQIIVKSAVEAPRCTDASVTELGDGFYRIDVHARATDAVIWLSSGCTRRLRFQDSGRFSPEGITLSADGKRIALLSPDSIAMATREAKICIQVPTERLWHRIRIDRRTIVPFPFNRTHDLDGPLFDFNAGAFGRIQIHASSKATRDESVWYARLEKLVFGCTNQTALMILPSISSKAQLVRWALEYKAQGILPNLLLAFSKRTTDGIPRP